MPIDLKHFTKILSLPEGFSVPTELTYKNIIAKPLTRADIDADLAGVNASIELIQKTRGGSWPQEKLSRDADLLDLAWHEREFLTGSSFAYVIHNDEGTYIGCLYLYPMGVRTELTEENLEYDIDASWWVTSDAYAQGYYQVLYDGLKHWLKEHFPFPNVYFSNIEK